MRCLRFCWRYFLFPTTIPYSIDDSLGPVFGAPPAAVAGQLIYVLTGQPSSLEKILPFTKGVTARAVIQPCTDVTRGNLLKITGNAMILGMVAEALVFAQKSGLGTNALDEYIQLMFPNSPFSMYSTRMITGHYAPVKPGRPGFQIDLTLKDCTYAMDIAKECVARVEVIEVLYRHLKRAKEVGGDNMDIRYFLINIMNSHIVTLTARLGKKLVCAFQKQLSSFG